MSKSQYTTVNFEFLKERYSDIYQQAFDAESLLNEDHVSPSCISSRKFLEKIVDFLYVTLEINCDNFTLFEKINNPVFQERLDNPKKITDLMHTIRIIGNNAAHSNSDGEKVTSEDALKALNRIFNLAIWFCKFNDHNFKYYEPFRDPTCLNIKSDSITCRTNKRAALVRLLAVNSKQFIDKEFTKNADSTKESISSTLDKNIVSPSVNEFGDDDQISIEEVFEQYSLTEGQQKLIKELNLFLKKGGANVFLLKGYAGTGKTFITKGIVEYLDAVKRSFVLLAPTGKAAKVLSEKSHCLAETLHKCIYICEIIRSNRIDDIPETEVHKLFFNLRHNNLSSDTVYIVDESSMIADFYSEAENLKFGSGKLLSDFFEFVNIDHNEHNKKVIFIGDPAQLPPVARGKSIESPALNEDYLKSNFRVKVSSFTLTEVVRQDNSSGVLAEATTLRKAISNKDFSRLKFNFNQTDFFRINATDFINVYDSLCKGEIRKDVIAIAYTNDEVYKLNNRIRQYLHNKKKFFNEEYDEMLPIRKKDLLLVTKTYCKDGIFIRNGEIVEVSELLGQAEIKRIKIKNYDLSDNIIPLIFQDAVLKQSSEDGDIYLQCKLLLTSIYQNKLFKDLKNKDKERLINQAMIVHFNMKYPNISAKKDNEIYKKTLENDPYFNAVRVSYGYAITGHKSQGSEWKNVFVFFDSKIKQHSEEFFRWTYTAITRTSKNLYVIDPPSLEILSSIQFI